MPQILIMPGIGGSGPDHWQSRWERLQPGCRRVLVPDWDRPDLGQWSDALCAALSTCSEPPLLVAHSLGCLVAAELGRRGGSLRGALLVAPPDPAGPVFPAVARSFATFSRLPLSFPSKLVASRNDAYASFEFAAGCARDWGSELCDAGQAGHINAESQLGDWPEGQRLLGSLLG